MKYFFILFILYLNTTNASAEKISSTNFEFYISLANKSYSADSSAFYAEKALKSTLNLNEQEYALYYLAKTYIEQSNYELARKYINSAKKINSKTKNKRNKGLVLLVQGKCKQLEYNYGQALTAFLEAESIFIKEKDTAHILQTNIILAEYYRNLGNFKDANTHIKIAFKIAKIYNVEDEILINLYNRAAAIKSETKDIDSSLYFSRQALKISIKNRNYYQQATSHNEIAFMLESKFQFFEALESYKKAEALWKLSDSKRNVNNAIENQARIKYKLNKFSESNTLLLAIEKEARKNNWITSLISIYSQIEKNYIGLNNINLSYLYKAKSLEARLLNYKYENEKELILIKTNYEVSKKENQLKKQSLEIELANIKYENVRKESKTLFSWLIILLILLIYITYLAIQRNLINKKLFNKNLEVDDANKKLLVSLNKSEILIQEVHHRVKNNLQFISSIIELEIDSKLTESNNNSLLEIKRRIIAMSLVHELLMNHESLEYVSSLDYTQKLVNRLKTMVHSEQKEIEFIYYADDIKFEEKQCIAVGMIISELVSNSIKYAFTDIEFPIITISLNKEEQFNGMRLSVADNGNGKIKDILLNKSLGYRLIDIFIEQLNGKYIIENNNGLVVTFTFPI